MSDKQVRRLPGVHRFAMVRLVFVIALIAVFPAIACRASDPTGFSNADIGSSLGYGFTAGSDSYSNGVLTVAGSGFGPMFNYWGDQFHFTYATVPANTNFRLVAEITSVSTASGTAPQVGLAMRAGTANADDEGGVLYAPLAGAGNQSAADMTGTFYSDTQACPQSSPGGVEWTYSGGIGAPMTPPFWLELIKVGNNFAEYKSADGVNWSMIAQNTSGGAYQAPGSVDVGFVICGGFNWSTQTDDASATATISNISLNESPVLPYETSWIGDSLTADSTGFVASKVCAMWVDSSGDCFTNYVPLESDSAVFEYTNGAVTKMFTTYPRWDDFDIYGDGQEGSITGDGSGNLYFWGAAGSTQALYEAPANLSAAPTVLTTTTPISIATGMAWDSSNSLLYVSDPSVSLPTNNILAINPSSGEVTTSDFEFATNYPGPMTVDGSGRLWIISEGNTPGSGNDVQPVGAPSTIYPAAVYCYNTDGVQQSIQIGDVTDTTKVYQSQTITGATNASPIVITTQYQNGLATGNSVTIEGVEGNTAANATWTITVLSPTTFSLNGSTGNGAYTFGGNVCIPSGMTVGWNPTAICYDSSTNQLLITDNGPDQDVKEFNLASWTSGTKTTADSTYGAVGGVFAGTTPGLLTDSSGDSARFYGPVGIGTDSSGNIYIADNYNFSKVVPMADIRSLTSTGTLNWDLSGLTYTNCGDFDPNTGDIYTINQHYRMNYANGAGNEWTQYSFLWDPFEQGVIPMSNSESEQCNDTREIDGSLYLFTSEQGAVGQINIYRMNGQQMIPCGSIFGNSDNTIEVWSDTNGDGIQENSEVSTSGAIAFSVYDDFDVDASGNIWLTEPGSANPSSIVELLLQGTNSYGVPVYSVASTSDYASYNNLPAPFTFSWTDPKIRYNSVTNTMYLLGYTYQYPTTHSYQATVVRVNNFTTSPTVAWISVLPVPDVTPLQFMLDYGDFQYESFDVENDKLFAAEIWGPVHVYDANTGAPITVLNEGPEASGNGSWDDCYKGMHAHYDPADNEYDVVEEDSGSYGRDNLWRWSPSSGSPSAKTFTVTGATKASPIVITTSTAHGLVTGQTVVINGVLGNTAANGTWVVTVASSTKVDLTTNYITGAESAGNGTYTSGTGTLVYGGVAGDQDIDAPTKAGSASQTAGTYAVNGGGAGYGLSGGKDQFNLCWSQMDGNGSIAAQVTGLSGSTAAKASAGVMIRNAIGTAGTDPEVSLVVTKSDGLIFQYRSSASGATTTAATLTGITPSSDEFIMLARSTTNTPGDTFSAYYSSTGVGYTQLGSSLVFTTPMNLTAYAGLAVTAAATSSLASGTFDRVLVGSVQPVVPAAPSGLSADSAYGGVLLNWSYDMNALQYNIYRGTTSGGETLLQSGVANFNTSWTDSSAVNGTTYYYEVTGVGTGGESARSNEVSVTYQNWNPSFEWPVTFNMGGDTWAEDPPDIAWTCTNSDSYGSPGFIGIAENGSSWNTYLSAENGDQYAFVDCFGAMSQTLTGFQSSTTYTVTFWAAQGTFTNGPESMAVTMDGTLLSLTQVGVGSVSNPVQPPSQTAWTEYSFQYTTGSSDPGSHTLEFAGDDIGNYGTSPVILDNIAFSPGL